MKLVILARPTDYVPIGIYTEKDCISFPLTLHHCTY